MKNSSFVLLFFERKLKFYFFFILAFLFFGQGVHSQVDSASVSLSYVSASGGNLEYITIDGVFESTGNLEMVKVFVQNSDNRTIGCQEISRAALISDGYLSPDDFSISIENLDLNQDLMIYFHVANTNGSMEPVVCYNYNSL